MVAMNIMSWKFSNIANGAIDYAVIMLQLRDNIPSLLWSLGENIMCDLLAKICPSLKSHTTT